MEKLFFAVAGLAVVLAGSASLQAQTLYMNPAASGNLTGTAEWATTLNGTYSQAWTDGNNMYFDPTGATTNYTISANITTAGTITLGNSNSTANIVKMNASGNNTISFANITFLDLTASDTLTYYGPTLPGGSFSVNGRGVFQLSGTPSSAISGTITVNSASGANQNAQILFSNSVYSGTSTHIALNGYNASNAQLSMVGGATLTIGSLTSNAYAQVGPSGGGGLTTLIIDQATNTIYASNMGGNAFGFTLAKTGLVQKQGSGNLTFSGANAFTAQYTDFAVAGGMLIAANTNSITTALDYNAIAVNAGGTLASDATGRTLVGNSQTLTGGNITAGANTNGFKVTTAGTSAIIDPTGTFAITELNAANGLTIKIDSASDKLSLFTLTGASAAGTFQLDLTGFSTIANATPYTVLSWLSGTGVDLTDFSATLPSGFVMDIGYGTNGFQTSTAGSVTSLQLQVIPEPATWLLLAGGSVFLGLLRRRRG
ncbi:MAG: PEP-CTERM sorting domain-containing protein [Verrucomicrobiae bacterium]